MTNPWKKRVSALLGAATLVAGLGLTGTATAAEPLPQPLIHYTFDDAAAGNVIANSGTAAASGNGTLTAGSGTSFADGMLKLSGGNNGGYVSVPTGDIQGKTDLTVSIWLRNNYTGCVDTACNTAAAYIGNGETANGYWLLNPSNPSHYVKSVMTTATADNPNGQSYNTEVGPGRTGNSAAGGVKDTADLAMYTAVFTDAGMTAYLNGREITGAPAQVAGGLTAYGDLVAYIANSSYPDPKAAIDVDDYAIYDAALSDEQVLNLYADKAPWEDIIAGVAVPEQVDADFVLPNTASGLDVTWSVTSGDAIELTRDANQTNASVTRPNKGEGDATVTLHAAFTLGDRTETKDYTVTVPEKDLSAEESAQKDLDALSIHNADDIRTNFSVPAEGANDSTISWTITAGQETASLSEDETTGLNGAFRTVNVARPAAGAEAATVKLRATVKNGDVVKTRDFTVTVQPMPADDAKDEAYVWAFFTGEGVGGEKISLAASKGNNALDWNTLNDGQPLFTSDQGEQGLRDPFIMKSKDGDKFYMLATDLKISGRPNANGLGNLNGFAGAQVNGSLYIEVWESTDLVNWGEQRHVKVSSDYAGNTWAPEAYWDDEIGKYVVYWASNLYDTGNSADRTNMTYNRMMITTTDDFVNFSEPQVWIDSQRGNGQDGKGSIDVTMQKDGDTYYRIYKDEASMTLRQEKSTDVLSTVKGDYPTASGTADSWTEVATKIGNGQSNGYGGTFSAGEGPSLFKANEGDVNGYQYYLFADQPNYHGGPNHYVPMATTDIASGDWKVIGDQMPESNFPTNSDGGKPRHGTVLPVTRAQYQTVLEAYAPDIAVTSVDAFDPIEVTEGETVTLPATAHLTMADGGEQDAEIIWDEVPSEPGVYTVRGVAQDASRMPVEAQVTIKAAQTDPEPEPEPEPEPSDPSDPSDPDKPGDADQPDQPGDADGTKPDQDASKSDSIAATGSAVSSMILAVVAFAIAGVSLTVWRRRS